MVLRKKASMKDHYGIEFQNIQHRQLEDRPLGVVRQQRGEGVRKRARRLLHT
jgi:hypothetical protein